MQQNSRLLLIGGSGQNVGKTTLACDIIKLYANSNSIIYIKSSNHFHGISTSDELIHEDKNIVVSRETSKDRSKDSSRALKAGAKNSYFIQCEDQHLPQAFNLILNQENNLSLIIAESAALRKYILPKFFIALIEDSEIKLPENKKILKEADYFIERYLGSGKINVEKIISVKNNKWIINL